ncbi:hypothetical protein BU24DRAFT_420914 [Aaosphaeria arxii CBS 175.79]|uniref:Uncharacterized protein n=1 Tax=Aaosphaeria arxii CBS 175.79 TaxID=1450172 RepID=A0A6A5XXG3_9PLEO|nr:uncharacterized protein BU24DRAFT_420914 [Aaosphaeria arxii CBS 175.79]KAF2017852.1 hypothetical protein BU24DRAFT_420914 [Aaosphaeria arxii CBS 175.79]
MMKAYLSRFWPPYYILIVLISFTAEGAALDFSETRNNTEYVGWHSGPRQRGTIQLLWSCLATIIATTWTILHLNVPQQGLSAWSRGIQKFKWMIITILFPEFIFAKSVCDLQVAIDDHFALKQLLDQDQLDYEFPWIVQFGWLESLLYRMFHLFDLQKSLKRLRSPSPPPRLRNPTPRIETSSSGPASVTPADVAFDYGFHTDRIWTLKHTYFANMGGLQRKRKFNDEFYSSEKKDQGVPITTAALLNCCYFSDHNPIARLILTEEDIDDKSKADLFVKAIAILQILWLLVSVLYRLIVRLPTTQLEISTAAFSALGVATWLANWYRPKDVLRTTPVYPWKIPDNYGCDARKNMGVRFTTRMTQGPSTDERIESCIRNDAIGSSKHVRTTSLLLALSTTAFGGLHSLAWLSTFPTSIERITWMAATGVAAMCPLAVLIANYAILHVAQKKVQKTFAQLRNKFQSNPREAREASPVLSGLLAIDYPGSEGRSGAKIEITVDNPDSLDMNIQLLCLDLADSMEQSEFSIFNHIDALLGENSIIYELRKTRPSLEFKCPPVGVIENMKSWAKGMFLYRAKRALESDTLVSSVHFAFNLLQNYSIIGGQLQTARRRVDGARKATRWLAILSGLLYCLARSILIVLTFAAFRKTDERVYINTWTNNLPSIS